jgi:hypothetical protein
VLFPFWFNQLNSKQMNRSSQLIYKTSFFKPFKTTKFLFVCILSVMMLVMSSAFGQITSLNAWTNLYHGTLTTVQNITYTIPTGSNARRVLVIAIASSRTTVGARTVTLTYGGQSLTSVNGDIASGTPRQHTQLYYLNEAGLDAATTTTLSVTVSGGTTAMTDVFAAIFDNVDQSSPITNSQTYSSGTSTVSTFSFSSALIVNTNDQAIEIVSSARTGSTSNRTITYATNWTVALEQTGSYNTSGSTNDLGIRNGVANRSVPATNATDVSSTTLSGASLASMTAMSLHYAAKYFRSLTSGNWSSTTTWEESYDNAIWVSATTVPTSADQLVIIQTGHTVTLTAAASASSLTINGILDLSTFVLTGTGTMTVSSTGTILVGGATNFPTGFTTTTLSSGSTVNYDNAGNQTISNQSYSNLTLSGGGLKTEATATVNGTLSMEGTATISAVPTYGAAATLQYNTATAQNTGPEWPAAFTAATLTGGVVVKNTGIITLLTANKLLGAGMPLNINANATLNTAAFSLSVANNFHVDGTLSSTSTGAITLNTTAGAIIDGIGLITNPNTFTITAAKTIASTANLTFSGTIAMTGAITVTNNGIVTTAAAGGITGSLASSTWSNAASTSVLNVGGPLLATGTLTATATGNTVNYTGGAQNVKTTTYANLILSGSGTKTFANITTVSGNLSISGTKANLGTFTSSSATLSLGGSGAINGSWGSSASLATHKNDTYFDVAASGIINTTTNTCTPPTVSITGSSSICVGGTSTLSPTTGGTWVSSNTGLATVTNGGVVTGVAAGSPTFTFTTSTGCTNTTSAIMVNASSPVGVSISANPSGAVCAGTSVTYTATPTNGGTTPIYQWKVNGTNVGTNSNTYTYTPVNSDQVSCIMTSNAGCATGTATTPINYFSWDNNAIPLTKSDFGLDAISVNNSIYVAGGVGGTCLAPATGFDVNLTFDGSLPEFNSDGIDYSVSYRRNETTAQIFTRGSSLIITGGSNFSVSYRVSDGAGSFTTTTSGNFAIPLDAIFHNYRFLYNPTDGYGSLYVDGSQVWISPTATAGLPMYWTGSGNLIVGALTDAAGAQVPTFDNLSMSAVKLNTASSQITATVNPSPVDRTVAATASPICSGTGTNITVATSVSGTSYQLRNNTGNVNIGSAVAGTGGTINLSTGNLASATTFNVLASIGTCTLQMTFTPTVTVNPLPVDKTVAASASPICSGTGTNITVALSVSGTTYQLRNNTGNVNIGSAVAGTGGTINLPTGNLVSTTTFNVLATLGSCTLQMTITPTVTINPLPNATYILSSSPSPLYVGTSSTLSLSGSESGVNYQLRTGTTPVGSPVAGTGAAISFAPVTPASTLTYNVLATNATSGCSIQETSTVTVLSACITVQPANVSICPKAATSFSVTATGSPTYQWQVSTNGGGTWTNIAAAGANPTYAGYTTATLSLTAGVTGVLPVNNGYQYRCVLSGGCTQTTNAATLTVQYVNISYTLSASAGLISVGGNTTLSLSGSQSGVSYQLRTGTTTVGSAVAGTGSSISFAAVSPTVSTQYNVLATNSCNSAQVTDTKTIIVNETGIIIDLTTCNGQPGLNFFTNSNFGTTSTNNYQVPDQGLFPGVTFGAPLGAYTSYTYGLVSNAIPDGNYVIANSTAGMYRTPQQIMGRDVWLYTEDRSATPGTGQMYIVNASNTPGEFYTETLPNLCENTRYEFSAEMINLYASNWAPYGTEYLSYYPQDGQGNFYTLLPNIDFLLDGKVALNTGNIMNDGSWKTFGFTFRTAPGQTSVTLSMRNNSTGGIGNDIALDNIIMRSCGPVINLNVVTSLPVCPGAPVTMTAQLLASDYVTPEYQWQKSVDNGTTWNNIPGETGTSYTNASPAYGNQFRFLVGETVPNLSNPNCSVASNSVSITTTAGITTTTPGSICGTGTVTLGATANPGATINWYATATGGTSLYTGTSYTTPTISSTTTYYVEATNGGCTSNPRTVVVATIVTNVVASVSIVANTGNSICAGTNVTFTATPVNGGATPSYQWKLNGADVGTNISTYSNAALANGNTVTCVMTTSLSSCVTGSPATSNAIVMTVTANPPASVTIAADTGNTICSGTNVTFTATPVNGGSTPTYQWQLNTVNIFGAQSYIYTSSSLVQGDVITCVMTSSLSCATGSPATSNAITMTVSPTLTAGISGGSSPICYNTAPGTLTATGSGGTGTYTYLWYKNGSSTGVTTQTYAPGALTATSTIYCAITSGPCGPVNTGTTTITVNATPGAPTGTAAQSFCSGASPTVANLAATGTTIQWYAASSGGSALATSTALVNGTHYYASQTVSGCESSSRFDVTATVNATPGTPTGTAAQSFCSGASPTVANLAATGTAIQWYAASSGGSALATSTALVNGTHYYASQTVSGCESSSRFDVTATVDPVSVGGSIAGSATVCSGANSTTLTLSGNTGNVSKWQSSSVADFSLDINDIANTTTSLTATNLTATTYYRAMVISGVCPSVTSSVATVTVNQLPTSMAGNDQNILGTLNATLAGNIPSEGTGTWTKTGGPGAVTFGNVNAYNTTVIVEVFGNYTFTWTITNGSCSGSDDVTITFYGASTWNGTTSTDWAAYTNWTPNEVPDGTNDIIIPNSVNNPVLSGTSTANDVTITGKLEIQDGATLTLESGPVLTFNSGAVVSTGNGAKIILKSDADYLNLSSSAPTLEVQRALTGIKGWRMVASPVTATYSEMFAAPLVTQGFAGATYSDKQPNLLWWDETDGGTTLQGWRNPISMASAIPAGLGHFHYIFNGAGITSGGFYSDILPQTMSVTGVENYSGSGSFSLSLSNTVRNPTGQTPDNYIDMNTADQGWNLIGNPTASTLDWDIASGWTKTNVDNSIYIWDPSANSGNGEYLTWNGTTGTLGNGRISPFQAFWVHANTASPAFSFTNAAKTAITGTFLKSTTISSTVCISLTLSGMGMETTSFITLSDNGISGPDRWDAYRLEPMSDTWLALFTNSSLSFNVPLVINSLPLSEQNAYIPLYVDAQEAGQKAGGAFTLYWEVPANWPDGLNLLLMDHRHKKAISMLQYNEYQFEQPVTKNAVIGSVNPLDVPNQLVKYNNDGYILKSAGSSNQNFSIVIGGENSWEEPAYQDTVPVLLSNYPNPFGSITTIRFSLPDKAPVRIDVFDIYGRLLETPFIGTFPVGLHELTWSPKSKVPGVLIIRLTSGKTVSAVKGLKKE